MSRQVTVAAFAILLLGCSLKRSDEETALDGSFIEIAVEDTIGREVGDERFIFGDICSLETDSAGNLIVLDALRCNVRRYTPSGEYLGEFAGAGSGPGELIDPMGMALLSGGGIAIADWAAWGIYLYDSNYDYIEFLGPMAGGSPLSLTTGADNSVIGLGIRFWNEDEQPAGEYFLSSWTDSLEETFRFLEGPANIEYREDGEVTINLPTVYFDTSPDYKLYAALSTDSTYLVRCFNSTGLELNQIEREWEKVPLNQVTRDEMDLETLVNGEEVSDEVIFAAAVMGVYLDDYSRVWVRLGTAPYPVFDVYSSSGEFVASVQATVLSDPLFELDFHIRGENLYAWNTDPVDYPKVFVLKNPLSMPMR